MEEDEQDWGWRKGERGKGKGERGKGKGDGGWGKEGAGALGAPAGMDHEEARYSYTAKRCATSKPMAR